MANLRKRVAACDLTRKRPTPEEPNANEPDNEQLDNRPLLTKVIIVKNVSAVQLKFQFMKIKNIICCFYSTSIPSFKSYWLLYRQ